MPSRPDPDALLRRIDADAPMLERREGRLKVFLGASPGVGKTYEMLREALDAKAQGVDVVAGYVEPHGRIETETMLGGLEVLPFREVTYRGIRLREFDLDAARARRPQLVLVDELAHTNADGSRHRKRWQDVLELLRHGIDVYTTVNVQHVESLRDVVAGITGVVQQETVSDGVFDRADTIELVDVPIDELLARLSAGKVYLPEQARAARQRFFRPGLLTALRQIALRFVADRVDRQMEVYRRAEPEPGAWKTRDRLVVALAPDASADALVRAARQMADRLGAPWTVVHIEPTTGLSDARRAAVQQALTRAESLGGRTVTLISDRPVDALLDAARRDNATRIVVGPPTHARWQDRLRRSFVDALIRSADGIDVLVTTGHAEEKALAPASHRRAASPAWAYAAAAAVVGSVVGLCDLMLDFELVNVAMLLLASVVLVAMRLGRGPTILATALSLLGFNFFFIPPRYTFAVQAEYAVSFVTMGVVALLVGNLTLRLRATGEAASARAQRSDALYRLGRDLIAVDRTADVLKRGLAHIARTFDVRVVALLPDADGHLGGVIAQGGSPRLDANEAAVARWAYGNGRPAGRFTQTLPEAKAYHLPLHAASRTLGVLALFPKQDADVLDAEARQQLEGFSNQIALALMRSDLGAWIGDRESPRS